MEGVDGYHRRSYAPTREATVGMSIRTLFAKHDSLRDCLVCKAKDASMERLHEEIGFLRGQVRALQKALGAPIPVPEEPRKPMAGGRPVLRLPPWANTLIGNGHVDVHEMRRRLEGAHPPAVSEDHHKEGPDS
jgi:hypothetical protein